MIISHEYAPIFNNAQWRKDVNFGYYACGTFAHFSAPVSILNFLKGPQIGYFWIELIKTNRIDNFLIPIQHMVAELNKSIQYKQYE